MKILHLIYTNGIAGAEKYLMHLLPGLANKGVECHLLVVCSGNSAQKLGSFFNELNGKGIPVTIICSGKPGFPAAALKVGKYMKKNGITYLHSHLLNSDIIATLAGYMFRNIRIISTKHGYSERVLRQVPFVKRLSDLKEFARKDIYYPVTKWVVKRAFKNYAVSRAISLMYFELGLCSYNMSYIHHGLEVRTAGQPRDKNSIVIVGRLEDFKGHKYLLEAIAQVKIQFPGVKLTVIGEGSNRPELENICNSLGISAHVKFLGFSGDPYSHVTSASIVALPSLFEPFGLVYLEAMALKTPIVAFDTAAGNEILDRDTAMLAEPANSTSLASCIIQLFRDPEKAMEMAERAFQKYRSEFTTEKMVDNTVAFYKKELSMP